MWLKLSSGREELVLNADHIKRLLSEGAVEIPDPRTQPETQEPEQKQEAEVKIPESEQSDGTINDDNTDNASQAPDSRSKRGKSGVHRRSNPDKA